VHFGTQRDMAKLGRGSESDVRISDISVSRCHTILRLQSDGIWVEDNHSKFGTLLRVREGLCLEDAPENQG